MQDRSAQFSMRAADLARTRTTYATMSPVSRSTAHAQATSGGDTDAFILARIRLAGAAFVTARLPLLPACPDDHQRAEHARTPLSAAPPASRRPHGDLLLSKGLFVSYYKVHASHFDY